MERCEMERIPQMKEVIGEKADNLIRKRLEEIGKLFINNTDNIRKDLETVLTELASDKKEGSLVISILRSSYIVKSHEFYIAYYEREVFVEEEPDCIYFSMKSAFQGIEEDLREMDAELHQSFIRVFEGEKEEIHRWYMEKVYIALEDIMKIVVENMQKSKEMDVYYGGYMEEVKIIGSI